MKLIPIQTTNDIEEASRLFAQIDSSITFMFSMNQCSALSGYLVKGADVNGAYFCYKPEKKAYIYIAFERENPVSSSLVSALCRENLLSLNGCSVEVWIKYENQPLHFQEYLSLLDTAMTYHDTADFYSSRASEYREDFLNGDKEGFFKAFGLGTALTGIYLRDWEDGDELALLAINTRFQRKGYGACLLRHAANMLFTTTEKNILYLYCVDHNTAANSFYIKQNMQISGHSYKMTILL